MQIPADLEIAKGLPPAGCSVQAAERYTRWLATHHYENFNVVSWLLPRHLHQHFYNLYAYCRWADDLGDEISDPGRALESLNEWNLELRDCYAGQASHPVLSRCGQRLPPSTFPSRHSPICSSRFARTRPFADTLPGAMFSPTAGTRQIRWAAWSSICAVTATRSGSGFPTPPARRCSLRNFWQDVTRDLEKGHASTFRLRRSPLMGLTEDDIVQRRFDARYVALMKELIARTRELFAEGLPLARSVDSALRVDIEMFSRGGLAVLDAIESAGYNTLEHRPSVSKPKQIGLLARALVGQLFRSEQPSVPFEVAPAAPRQTRHRRGRLSEAETSRDQHGRSRNRAVVSGMPAGGAS